MFKIFKRVIRDFLKTWFLDTNFKKKVTLDLILTTIQNFIFTPLVGGCGVAALLLPFSLLLCLLWLCVLTTYFLYVGHYKGIPRIWGFTIGLWYAIFITCMSEVPLVIGFEHTKVLVVHLFDNDLIGFRSLCFQTIFLLDDLSRSLGVVIYVPSCLGALRFLLWSFFKNDKRGCSGREDPTDGKPSSWFSFVFRPKTPERSKWEEDTAHCASLEQMMRESKNLSNLFYAEVYQTDRGRITKCSENRWRGVWWGGTQRTCSSRDLTRGEIGEIAGSKKPGKYWGPAWWYL
jgi:hypothetical protein